MAVYKPEGSKYWYFRYQFRGTLIHQSSRSRNRQICERLEREDKRRRELGQLGLKEIGEPIKFKDAVKAFIKKKSFKEAKGSWAPKTQTIHNGSLDHLLPFFGKRLLTEITPESITEYQQKRLKEPNTNRPVEGQHTPDCEDENCAGCKPGKYSNRSVNIEVSLVCMVLVEHGLWANISKDVTMLEEEKNKGRKLDQDRDEMKRLLVAVKANPSRSLYPAVLLSITTGLRNEELRLLQWSNVDFKRGTITVGKSKTDAGTGRVVPLSQVALQALEDWAKQFPNRQQSHYVFPSERYGLIGTKHVFGGRVMPYSVNPLKPIGSWRSAWESAKNAARNVDDPDDRIHKLRWHDLRYSFVSAVVENGATAATVRALAGWVDKEMIDRYSKSDRKQKQAAVTVFDELISDAFNESNVIQN